MGQVTYIKGLVKDEKTGIFKIKDIPWQDVEDAATAAANNSSVTSTGDSTYATTDTGAAAVRTFTFPAGTFESPPVIHVTPVGANTTEKLFVTIFDVTAASFKYVALSLLGVAVGNSVHITAVNVSSS